jgi:heptaprenyl diphosphate synthase
MKKITTHEIAAYALMLSMIFALATVEGLLPPLPMHMRFGLSNVVTMYALFFVGRKPAFMLAIMKSAFVFLTRGPIASLLSLCGGVFSLLVIAVLAAVRPDTSYFMLSIAGALAHNLAQLAAASVLVSTNLMLVYLPVMTAAGIPAGSLTALLLRSVMPVLGKIGKIRGEKAEAPRTCA